MRKILLIADDNRQLMNLRESAVNLAASCGCSLVVCKPARTLSPSHPALAVYERFLHQNHQSNDFYISPTDSWDDCQTDHGFPSDTIFLNLENLETDAIKKIVIKHSIWLLLMNKPPVSQLRQPDNQCKSFLDFNKINCPVLMISGDQYYRPTSGVAYVTDLRYCNYCVIRFLKVFNCPIFLVHVTAPGLVDLDDRYAQDLVRREISVKASCRQLFLFNIKGRQMAEQLDKYFELSDFNMLTFFNSNQSVSERIMGRKCDNLRNYHDLPFLIFPYLNWYHV